MSQEVEPVVHGLQTGVRASILVLLLSAKVAPRPDVPPAAAASQPQQTKLRNDIIQTVFLNVIIIRNSSTSARPRSETSRF